MTTIIGVDAALANTGIAIWRDGLMSVTTIHTAPGMPEERWQYIGDRVWAMARKDPDTIVALEAVFVGAKMMGTALELAYLHAVLRMGLFRLDVPVVVVDAMAVKQYAVGVGRATPREMIAATSRLRLGFEVGDDHQADAAFLVALALDHYGMPMCQTSAAGRKALDRQSWPKGWRPARPGQTPGQLTPEDEPPQRISLSTVPSPFLIGPAQ